MRTLDRVESQNSVCPICHGEMYLSILEQQFVLYVCSKCGVHYREYRTEKGEQDHFQQVKMESYSRSVRVIRERSYKVLVEVVLSFVHSGRWLDVGCSFGWLLRYVQSHGFNPYGVDPSPSAVQAARNIGLSVKLGTYPNEDGRGAPYQVISFIDVLEHLPDPFFILRAVRHHLSPEGVLVVQVPDRECLMYQIALLMFMVSRGRFGDPLRRLYLDGLDFPHIFYYSQRNLNLLLEKSGFQVVRQYRSPIGSWDTMVDRITYLDESTSRRGVARVLAFGASALQAIDNGWGHGGLLTTVSRIGPS